MVTSETLRKIKHGADLSLFFGKREGTLETKTRPTFIGNLVKIGGVFGWFAIPAEDGLMQPTTGQPLH